MDTVEKINTFLTPGESHFISPFAMSGMKEAVELITKARDEDWSVLVYGDYDADGICSTTIMRHALEDYGIKPYVFIPERLDGYGLKTKSIDKLMEEYNPQLFITVDCGISGHDEVKYMQEGGAEVIVTDHHELPDVLPDCIIINPKIQDDYIYDNLCGAGVAFKVGVALNGKDFYKYLDYAAIATVADNVPLMGENRDIVAEGLKIINANPKENYELLFNKPGELVKAQSVSFGLAPKVNAAGRMGSAKTALDLFMSQDLEDIKQLSEKLISFNSQRQEKCDKQYISAKKKLAQKGAYGKVIMLYDEWWGNGLVGITAAKIADEYSRPAILFSKYGDIYRGSARSIEGINIYEALKACSMYLVEFGGHSLAAGVTVKGDNFDKLEAALNDYLASAYPDFAFVPTIYIDGDDIAFSDKIARELELLEPCGVGNKKPLFKISVNGMQAKRMKWQSPHLVLKSEDMDFTYFSGQDNLQLLQSPGKKDLIFEYDVSEYKGRQYIKGLIRDVVYEGDSIQCDADEISANRMRSLSLPEVKCNKIYITREEIENMLAKTDAFGTVFLAESLDDLKGYTDIQSMRKEVFSLSSKDLTSLILISPNQNVDLSGYRTIVYLADPSKTVITSLAGKDVYICKDKCLDTHLNLDRDYMLEIYKWICKNAIIMGGEDALDAANTQTPFPKTHFLFALLVFSELSLLSFSQDGLIINRGMKTDLKNSYLYTFMTEKG